MSVEVTCRMGDNIDNPIVEKTAVHIEVTGLDQWTPAPTEEEPGAVTQNVYRIVADAPGAQDNGQSVAFTPNSEGAFTWDDYVFPYSGSWSLKVYQLDENGDLDSVIKSQAVTVDAAS